MECIKEPASSEKRALLCGSASQRRGRLLANLEITEGLAVFSAVHIFRVIYFVSIVLSIYIVLQITPLAPLAPISVQSGAPQAEVSPSPVLLYILSAAVTIAVRLPRISITPSRACVFNAEERKEGLLAWVESGKVK